MNIFRASQYPSRNYSLKQIRKVYPGAEIVPQRAGGFALIYMSPAGPTPVLAISEDGGKNSGRDRLAFAILKAAFSVLGFETAYKPGWPNGKFTFTPVKGFEAPEDNLPIELDPATSEEEVEKMLNQARDTRRAAEAAARERNNQPTEKES